MARGGVGRGSWLSFGPTKGSSLPGVWLCFREAQRQGLSLRCRDLAGMKQTRDSVVSDHS